MTNETVKINNFYSVCKIKFLYETLVQLLIYSNYEFMRHNILLRNDTFVL